MCKCVTFSKITSDVSDLGLETTISSNRNGELYHFICLELQPLPPNLVPQGSHVTTMATENLIEDLATARGSQGETVLYFFFPLTMPA